MDGYKLNEKAEMDLDRLYEYGVLSFGLDQADRYYDALIDRFSEMAQTLPVYGNPLTISAAAIAAVCTAVIRFIIALRGTLWKLCGFWGVKIPSAFNPTYGFNSPRLTAHLK